MPDLTIDQIVAIEQRREKMRPLAFAVMLPELTEAAWACGYAIAVHGSLTRDFDLLAAPWTDEAVPAEDLILALCAAVDALGRTSPERKPHGRIAWSIHVGYGMYFDVSVMPRGNSGGGPNPLPALGTPALP